MHEALLYLVVSATIGFLLVSWLATRPNLSKLPVLNPLQRNRWGFKVQADKNSFLSNARELIREGLLRVCIMRPSICSASKPAFDLRPASLAVLLSSTLRMAPVSSCQTLWSSWSRATLVCLSTRPLPMFVIGQMSARDYILTRRRTSLRTIPASMASRLVTTTPLS